VGHGRETRLPTEKTNINIKYREKPVYSAQSLGGEYNELMLGKYPRMGRGEVEKLKEEGAI